MRTLSASALSSFLTWMNDLASRSVKAPGATESDAAYSHHRRHQKMTADSPPVPDRRIAARSHGHRPPDQPHHSSQLAGADSG